MQPTLLNNRSCIYCGCDLDKGSRTKEHVIGRRFVPKGSLAESWNLIAWACHKCNNEKSSLEDDISAITMHANAWSSTQGNDPVLESEALRKGGNSFSKRTGKRIKNSSETANVKLNFGTGVTMNIKLTAPPQHIPARLHALARYHILGFFYFLTYDETKKVGKFPSGTIYVLDEAIQSNWGNRAHLSFMQKVLSWDDRLIAPGLANGYFRAAIRRRFDTNCFSWAFEWNKNLRMIGFFGNEIDTRPEFDSIPGIRQKPQIGDENFGFSVSEDIPIKESDDVLFSRSGTDDKPAHDPTAA